MRLVIVGHVIRVGRVLEQRVSIVERDSDDRCFRVRGVMRGQAGHERAAKFEYRPSGIPCRRLDTRQRQSQGCAIEVFETRLKIN